MTVPVGVSTPIMSLSSWFYGDLGGIRDAYGSNMGKESLFGSPSFNTILRRSMCASLVGRAGDDGGGPPFRFSLGEEVMGAVALSLARVGAYADELLWTPFNGSRAVCGAYRSF